MTTIAEELERLPKMPTGIRLDFDKGYSPSDSQLIDFYEARFSLYQRAVREYLEAVDALCTFRAKKSRGEYDFLQDRLFLSKVNEALANLRLVAKEVA